MVVDILETDKKYGVIYADPPWTFKTYSAKGKEKKSAEAHYRCMRKEDIQALPVQGIAAVFFLDNAVKTARGFAVGAVATITGHKDAIVHLVKEQQDFDRITTFDGFKPKVTYRLDEQLRWKLLQARVKEERNG